MYSTPGGPLFHIIRERVNNETLPRRGCVPRTGIETARNRTQRRWCRPRKGERGISTEKLGDRKIGKVGAGWSVVEIVGEKVNLFIRAYPRHPWFISLSFRKQVGAGINHEKHERHEREKEENLPRESARSAKERFFSLRSLRSFAVNLLLIEKQRKDRPRITQIYADGGERGRYRNRWGERKSLHPRLSVLSVVHISFFPKAGVEQELTTKSTKDTKGRKRSVRA